MPRSPPIRPLQERFWEKVDVRGPDECWEWTAARIGDGYGNIGVITGKSALAHRVSYEFANGPIPTGRCVLHTCDNPPCVNSAHLFVGTRADNAADRDAKGRGGSDKRRGERNGSAKLTAAIVAAIRAEYVPWEVSTPFLARKYGISKGHVHRIVTGASW